MKKVPQGILYMLSGVLFLTGALVLYWWTSNFTSWKMREQLQIISPLFLEIIFFLVIVACVLNISHFKKVFAHVRRGTWCMLALIVVGGLIVTMFVVPRDHRIYYDEDIYQSIGQNIAYLKNADAHSGEGYGKSFSNLWKRFVGRAAMCNEGRNDYGELRCDRLEYNKEPNGWPYILSVVFRLFGVHEIAAFLTNNLVYALTIVTTFFIGYLLFNSYRVGLYSALIFALMPECMIWSNTTAVEPSAALFPGMALACSLIAIRVREVKALFLLAVVAAFAIQFRPESIMFLSVIGVVILIWGRGELKKGEFYLLVALFFLLIIPHLAHLFSVKEMGWGSSGPKFSF
ncbi:MAG: glycosyltransferase family 39 protein, partial [Thermodesulfobacteriota bacterium]|nr:glycosyltransferase family 39 protein [Thermodesulfobacteriota bacterium]